MATLNREALLKRNRPVTKVESPTGNVHIKQLSGMERVQYEHIVSEEKEQFPENQMAIRSMARLLVLTLCDEKGVNILKNEDLETLANQLPFSELQFLFTEALKVNGLSSDEMNETVKN